MKYLLILALTVASLFSTILPSAAVTEQDSSSFFETTYDSQLQPNSTDLLYNRPITSTVNPDQNFALTGINDGQATSAQNFDNTFFGNDGLGSALTQNPAITIQLDTSNDATGSTTGWDINLIGTINGWQNFDLSFSDQSYALYYSTVADPNNFILVTTVNYHPFGASANGDQFDQEPGASNADVSSSEVLLTDLGITNAAALKFVLSPSTGIYDANGDVDTSGGAVIREFVAFGSASSAPIPEPSTWAMMIAGLAFMGFCLRRKIARA